MRYFNKTNIALSLVVVMAYLSMYNTSGSYASNGGRTNAPFDNGTCSTGSSCHASAGSFTPSITLTLLSGSTPVTSYSSNTSYTLRISISSSTGVTSNTRYGFQAVCVQSSTNNGINSNWGTMPSNTKKNTVINSRTYISHSYYLTSGTVDVPWTSPATSTGNITFYAAGLVANKNNQQTGDNAATTYLTITPASSGCTTPAVNLAKTDVKCYEGADGAVTATTTGGTGPFSFNWTGPGGYNANSQNVSGLKAGNYSVEVTALGGCKDTFYATINQPPKLNTGISANSPYCAGTNMKLSAAGSGGNGVPYSYSWVGPKGPAGANSIVNIPSASAGDSGDYIVTVTDSKSCTMTDTVNVQVDSTPQAEKIVADVLTNNTVKFSLENERYVNGILWEYGDGKSDNIPTPNHTFVTNGTFNVKATITNGCGNDVLNYTINIWPESVTGPGKDERLVIYPNPAQSDIIIRNSSGHIQSIAIISMHGSVVYQKDIPNLQQTNVGINEYAPGMYMIHIKADDKEYIKTLLIKK